MERGSYVVEHRVLLAWAQGYILVPWRVSSLIDSCIDLQLTWCGPGGIWPFESGEEGGG